MTSQSLALLILLLTATGLALWWLLFLTEGAYLGAGVVAWLYDRTAGGYEGIKRFEAAEDQAFLAWPLFGRMVDTVGAEGRLLDVATGTGRLPAALLDIPAFRGEIVGLDASAQMLDVAEVKLGAWIAAGRLSLLHQRAVPLPFEDASFDAVSSLEALEFLPDLDAALAEMRRVLRPGGWLMLSNRVGWEARLMPGKAESPAAFEARLARLGLEEIQTRPWQSYYNLVLARKPCDSEPDAA